MTSLKQLQFPSGVVVKQLLEGAYLCIRLMDFVHFLQVNYYGGVDLSIKKSAQLDQYLSRERISWFPWQPFAILKFRFREILSVPNPHLFAKFGARRSVNGRGVAGQTHTVTFLTF